MALLIKETLWEQSKHSTTWEWLIKYGIYMRLFIKLEQIYIYRCGKVSTMCFKMKGSVYRTVCRI